MTDNRGQRELGPKVPEDERSTANVRERNLHHELEGCVRALNEERQRYAALLACLQMEVWIWPNRDSRQNHETVGSPASREVAGPEWLQRVVGEEHASASQSWHEALLGQNVFRHRCTLRNGQSVRRVEVRAAPVRRADGKTHEWVGVLSDIPPLTSQPAALIDATEPSEPPATGLHHNQQNSRELGEFAQVISHDLKAPLRGIHQACQFLIEDEGPHLSEQAQLLLDEISQRATKMRGLIDGVLRYSEATLSDERHVVDVAEVLNEASFAVRPSEDFQFHLQVLPATLYLEYNQTQLLQVFQNLLDNAVKYGSKGRRVDVSCVMDEQWLTFCVRDYGDGVPEYLRTRIFRLFESGSGTMGAGVGLSIARKVVERHGGKIWAETAPGNYGVCFKFTVPRALVRHHG